MPILSPEATQSALRALEDSGKSAFREALEDHWNAQRRELNNASILEAIESGELPQEVWDEWQDQTARIVEEHYNEQWERAARFGAARLVDVIAQRVEVDVDFAPFRAAIAEWTETRAAATIEGLNDVQRRAVRAVLRETLAGDGITVGDLDRALRPIIGLTPRQALAVRARRRVLIDQGNTPRDVERAALRYADRLTRVRSERIARTEVAAAYNQGHLSFVSAAEEEGLIDNARKEWYTAEDERVCPICFPLHEVRVGIGQVFPGVGVDAPPAHPSCRCTMLFDGDF